MTCYCIRVTQRPNKRHFDAETKVRIRCHNHQLENARIERCFQQLASCTADVLQLRNHSKAIIERMLTHQCDQKGN